MARSHGYVSHFSTVNSCQETSDSGLGKGWIQQPIWGLVILKPLQSHVHVFSFKRWSFKHGQLEEFRMSVRYFCDFNLPQVLIFQKSHMELIKDYPIFIAQ